MALLGITGEFDQWQRRLDESDERTGAMKGENAIENVVIGTVGTKTIREDLNCYGDR
jgi:hypothetical protein